MGVVLLLECCLVFNELISRFGLELSFNWVVVQFCSFAKSQNYTELTRNRIITKFTKQKPRTKPNKRKHTHLLEDFYF